MAKAPQRIMNMHQHSTVEIAEQILARIRRSRGTMVVFIRPDGRVRILRMDDLDEPSDQGLLGTFSRRHTPEQIKLKLEHFAECRQAYLGLNQKKEVAA